MALPRLTQGIPMNVTVNRHVLLKHALLIDATCTAYGRPGDESSYKLTWRLETTSLAWQRILARLSRHLRQRLPMVWNIRYHEQTGYASTCFSGILTEISPVAPKDSVYELTVRIDTVRK